MSATDYVTGRNTLNVADLPYYNATGSTINKGELLKLDTSNLMSSTQPLEGMKPTSAATDQPLGFAVQNTPTGQTGTMQCVGVAVGIAAGAVTAGVAVGGSTTAGDVTAATSTDPAVGFALTAAANAADPIRVLIALQTSD
jgi:hypothetical protein